MPDPIPGPSLRILIVEDQLLISRQLDAIASEAGHVVVGTTAEAERACALVQAVDPDLVLLDVDLKGPGSGLDVARYAAEHSGALVVFTTADRRRLPPDLHGAVGAVEKPFTRGGLSSILRFVADRRRMDRPRRPDSPHLASAYEALRR